MSFYCTYLDHQYFSVNDSWELFDLLLFSTHHIFIDHEESWCVKQCNNIIMDRLQQNEALIFLSIFPRPLQCIARVDKSKLVLPWLSRFTVIAQSSHALPYLRLSW